MHQNGFVERWAQSWSFGPYSSWMLCTIWSVLRHIWKPCYFCYLLPRHCQVDPLRSSYWEDLSQTERQDEVLHRWHCSWNLPSVLSSEFNLCLLEYISYIPLGLCQQMFEPLQGHICTFQEFSSSCTPGTTRHCNLCVWKACWGRHWWPSSFSPLSSCSSRLHILHSLRGCGSWF